MDPVTGSLIGAGVSSGGGIISTILTNKANKKLTEEAWARDDTAVQRRAADLQAAGINPLLAAGQAAGNTNPIEMKGADIADFSGAFISGKQAKLKEKIDEKTLENQSKLIETQIAKSQVDIRNANLQEAQLAHDLMLNIRRDTRSIDTSGMVDQIVKGIDHVYDFWKNKGGETTFNKAGLDVRQMFEDWQNERAAKKAREELDKASKKAGSPVSGGAH